MSVEVLEWSWDNDASYGCFFSCDNVIAHEVAKLCLARDSKLAFLFIFILVSSSFSFLHADVPDALLFSGAIWLEEEEEEEKEQEAK